MKCIEYSSNNSGGSFWLSDVDWLALEAAGWEVDWARDGDPRRLDLNSTDRYFGSLATSARRFGLSYDDAVREFERVTGQDADDEGCPCCGSPHSFYEGDAEPRVLKVQAERAESLTLETDVHNLVVEYVDSPHDSEELIKRLVALIQQARALELEG